MSTQLPVFTDVIDVQDPNDPLIVFSLHSVEGGTPLPSRDEARAAIADERVDELEAAYFYSMVRSGRVVFYVPDGNREHEHSTRTAATICLRHVVASYEGA